MATVPKRPRNRPLNLDLTKPTESGKTHFVTLTRSRSADVWVHDRLRTREEVRADDLQMFVDRNDEDFLVIASFHFPFVRGRARQFKFTLPVIHQLRTEAGVKTISDGALVEQAIVDLEQLCKNFVSAALPKLAHCALMLARSNPNPAPPVPMDAKEPEATNEGLEEFIVCRDQGWPIKHPRYKHYDVVRLPPSEASAGVNSGYLIPARDAENDMTGGDDQYLAALTAYRSQRAAEALAAQYRPTPTNAAEFMRSKEGTRLQQQIVTEFKAIADQLFPSSPGPKLTRTAAAKAALAAELRAELAQELGAQVTRGERVSKEAAYEKMAERQHGDPPKFLGVSAIKNLIGRDIKPTRRTPRKSKPKPRS